MHTFLWHLTITLYLLGCTIYCIMRYLHRSCSVLLILFCALFKPKTFIKQIIFFIYWGSVDYGYGKLLLPVPAIARSKVWVCGRSPAEIVDSNPVRGMEVCLS